MMNESRRMRIAKGSDARGQEVNQLSGKFKQMQKLMKVSSSRRKTCFVPVPRSMTGKRADA